MNLIEIPFNFHNWGFIVDLNIVYQKLVLNLLHWTTKSFKTWKINKDLIEMCQPKLHLYIMLYKFLLQAQLAQRSLPLFCQHLNRGSRIIRIAII